MFRRIPGWLIVAVVIAAAGTFSLAVAQNGGNDGGGGGEEKLSLLELLAKGKWFMVPIGLCSLMGLALIIERLVALRRRVAIPDGFIDGLETSLNTGEPRKNGLAYCRANPSPIARIAAAGLRKLPKGEETAEEAIESAGAAEVAKLRRNLRMLYGVSAVAPMLGLLGTVWGMIEAFQVASAMGLGRAEKLASGIYEALVTTFAGLTVAIPCLIFYYYFQGKIDRIVTEMDDASVYLMEHHFGDEAPLAPTVASETAAPTPGANAPAAPATT
jgi:biopolymer transport protein ExbB